MKEKINISLVQADLIWHAKDLNKRNFSEKLNLLKDKTDIVIFPEMFTTGFTMDSNNQAEPMDGNTVHWMKQQAVETNAVIAGSTIIKENNTYYNRFLWVTPTGQISHYDKRHLFAMAGENKSYTRGAAKAIFKYQGWKICPLICYDLRFPVWSRNAEDYDLLIYIANWPVKRIEHWKTLLKARAIENQVYVAGVNRVGSDENGNDYSGDSSLIDPLGNVLSTISPGCEGVETIEISKKYLDSTRKQLPFLKDRDQFIFD